MSGQWKPGDVAVADFCGDPNVRVSRYRHGWARLDDPDDFINDDDRYEGGGPRVTDARPLVVIDPDSPEQIERLFAALRARVDMATLADALRSLIAPPKPEEPLGLGAVVEDAEGVRWLRHTGSIAPWHRHDGKPNDRSWRYYDDISAVRILSGGVA